MEFHAKLVGLILGAWLVSCQSAFPQSTPTARYNTVADMLALPINPNPSVRLTANVTGRLTTDDGGGGIFFYYPSDGSDTNLGTIFKPNASDGRWIRQFDGPYQAIWFGAIPGDGLEDQIAITNALSLGATNHTLLPGGHLLIDPDEVEVELDSNRTLEFSPDTYVTMVPSTNDNYKMFKSNDKENVRFVGNGATIIGDRLQHVPIIGETGIGIRIAGCTNSYIGGFNIYNCWGDGILVAQNLLGPCDNFVVENCYLENNRRNNMSVTSAQHGVVRNCWFVGANGTLPEAGIDLEPDPGEADLVFDILVEGCFAIGNAGDGFLSYGGTFRAAYFNTFANCFASGNGGRGIRVGSSRETALSKIFAYDNNVGVRLDTTGGAGGNSENITLNQVYSWSNASNGVEVVGRASNVITNSSFTDVKIWGNGSHGLYLNFASYNTFNNVNSASNLLHGINLDTTSVDGNVFTAPQVAANGQRGISLFGANRNKIEGGSVYNNGQENIRISNSDFNTVQGVEVYGASQSADNTYDNVNLQNTSSSNLVTKLVIWPYLTANGPRGNIVLENVTEVDNVITDNHTPVPADTYNVRDLGGASYLANNFNNTNGIYQFTRTNLFTPFLMLGTGTNTRPAINFTNDVDSGLYLEALNVPAISADSIKIAAFDAVSQRLGGYLSWRSNSIAAVEIGKDLIGLGSPEGVVSAPPGSLYRRRDGTTNTMVYYKTGGTAESPTDTNWVPVADTGGAGSGTVTDVDAEDIEGFATASVANPTTAPVITYTPFDPGFDSIITWDDTAGTLTNAAVINGSYDTATGTWTFSGGGGGSGTVTNFTAGNLSPFFTTSEANTTTFPDLTFANTDPGFDSVHGWDDTEGAAKQLALPASVVLNAATDALELDGDDASPADGTFYGKLAGNKGWFDLTNALSGVCTHTTNIVANATNNIFSFVLATGGTYGFTIEWFAENTDGTEGVAVGKTAFTVEHGADPAVKSQANSYVDSVGDITGGVGSGIFLSLVQIADTGNNFVVWVQADSGTATTQSFRYVVQSFDLSVTGSPTPCLPGLSGSGGSGGGGVAGTIINSGGPEASIAGALFYADGTSGTNALPSSITISGETNLLTATLTATNWVRFPFTTLTYTGGTNVLVDLSAGSVFGLTLTNTAFIIPTNVPSLSQTLYIHLLQDGVGGRTVTWEANTKWPSGAAPVISAAANAYDLVTLTRSFKTSTNLAATIAQDFQ